MIPFPVLRRLFATGFRARPAPDAPVAVIGDIHGRVDLLEKLVVAIADRHPWISTLVFVGDYVDRGEQSAQVLSFLQSLQQWNRAGKVVCLKGNHEAMMLDFLDHPEEIGVFWLQNGGIHTLASFGIPYGGPEPTALRAARDRLRARLPAGTEAWLRALPVSFRSGNLFVVHAGADPAVAPDQQDETHLLWGHPEFEQTQRRDGIWVAHGHTIREQPVAAQGRIAVDTGAYATNRLTAGLIRDGEVTFLTTDGTTVSPASA